MIYFDNAATTKVDAEILDKIIPYFSTYYANPSSNHILGKELSKTIHQSKQEVANLLNCEANNIVFTSGSTESINTILKGVFFKFLEKGNHIITVKTEHKAVLDTCHYLETIGAEITYLDVNENGEIDLFDLENAITKNTILICVMHANNETGVIHPIEKIGQICENNQIPFFVDATQSIDKIPIPIDNIDFLCFSGHKIHAPKGIGVLYSKNTSFVPLLHGGKQDLGIRSGTLNVPGIVGIAEACKLLVNNSSQIIKIKELQSYLETELLKYQIISINGKNANRLPNISNICFHDIDGYFLIEKLSNFAISQGSACNSSIISPSYVLKAMKLSNQNAFNSIRISLSKYSTKTEIEELVKVISQKT